MKEDMTLKKLISFLLCAAFVGCALVSCVDKTDPGTEMNVYMEMPSSFDPAAAYTDQAAAQFLPLIYQGLFTIDEKGKLQKAMCDDYTVDGNVIEFTLNDTCWSDNTKVSATDYVYAWKRILDPEFQCEAASLLFYIKNAAEVKNGDMTIDDLCLYASGESIIRVELIDESYVDQFLMNCASVALYPLREDAVSKIKLSQLYYDNRDANGNIITEENPADPVLKDNEILSTYTWSTIGTIAYSCGPFYLKKTSFYPDDMTATPTFTMERNKYYYRDNSELGDDALRKYVQPYRLNIVFISPEDALTAYNDGTPIETFNSLAMVYNNNLPLEARSADDNVKDLLATYSIFFNTNKPQFANADVRKALGSVLDRNEIVAITKYGKAAAGLINEKARYGDSKDTFRSKAGDAVLPSMSVDEAKNLIAGSGVSFGEGITLTVRDNETEKAVAEYIKGKWESLGITVTVEALGNVKAEYYDVVGIKGNSYDKQSVYTGLNRSQYLDKYRSGEFDVIGVQYNMLSTDPFAALAPFAPRYSGNAYDFTESSDSFELVPGVTGYNNPAYSELIDRCLTTFDAAERAKILADAEKMLLGDAVAVPLYYMQTGAKIQSNLTGLIYRYDGFVDFSDAEDKNYKFEPQAEAAILPTKVWNG